jgi:FkbM family methyltransferase
MSISTKERSAVLALMKHFGEWWHIIDVGSNKGEWSDILINERDQSTEAGKYTFHFFEPNELLLNYTRVKYDRNKSIHFHPYACSNATSEKSLFYYFTNENNGLSSLYDNPKWDDLPKQKGYVKTIALDYYPFSYGPPTFDIIKIDVEGAEFDVLQGCRVLMQEKRVKVIQVEYSEHYQLAGVTFKDIIRFAKLFGYTAYDFDGEHFQPITEDSFTEDYRLDNFYLSYLPIGRYHYTQDWNGEFKKNTQGIGAVNFALEIGCFEGLTSNYICDHLLVPGGRMIAVDPLTDEYLPGHEDNNLFIGQYERFLKNTQGQPIELVRSTSAEAFPYLKQYLFDFIYIDGDHRKEAVYNDAIESFQLLRRGGHMLFDDYGWRDETREGIDQFLHEQAKRIQVLIKDYQVLIKKR